MVFNSFWRFLCAISSMQKNFPHLDDYIIILAFADAEGELDKSTSTKYNQIVKKVRDKIKDTYNYEF